MRRYIVAFLLVLIASEAVAFTSDIRSGDHPTFSRLVIDIPVNANWDVGETDNGYGLRISGVTQFETNSVFDRIAKDRISAMSPGRNADEILIGTNCDCGIDAFLWRPDKLVVDILDNNSIENVSKTQPFYQVPKAVNLPIITSQIEIARPTLPIEITHSRIASNGNNTLENLIIEGISRGASQGLLKPTRKLLPNENSTAGDPIFENESGLLAHTSMENALMVSGDNPENEDVCLPSEYYDVPNWGSESGFVDHISELRSATILEFDAPDSSQITNLSKGYIFYGFGREAVQALKIDNVKSQERSVIRDMAAVLDGDETLGVLIGQENCDSAAALWSFLANARPQNATINRDTILRSFRALPVHLQTHLGPMLSSHFLIKDDLEGAELALGFQAELKSKTTEEEIALANLASKDGQPISAAEKLAEISQTDSRITPETVLAYLDLANSNDMEIDLETLALAEIMRFENRGTELEKDLLVGRVRALISIGEPLDALVALRTSDDILQEVTVKELYSKIAISFVNQIDDIAFLEYAFEQDIEGINSEAQNRMAERLIDTGFPEQASVFVSGAATGEDMLDRRYIRAKAAIDSGDPTNALNELRGMTSDRAIALRSKAEIMLSSNTENPQFNEFSSWRAGNWAELSQGEDPLLKSISLSVLGDTQSDPFSDTPLAQGRALLGESEEKRSLFASILNRFESPTE